MSGDEVAAELSAFLGGEIVDLRRLSGGASRVTSRFDVLADSKRRRLILQQYRSASLDGADRVALEASLLAAASDAGVPVPRVVAAGHAAGLNPLWLLVERLDGESVPRKILRDEEFARARQVLTEQCGRALASIHRIDPHLIAELPQRDPFGRPLGFLDSLGSSRPVLEIVARWLDLHRPESATRRVVHGDFRLGNFLVDTHGLRAVLDWELAHMSDPAEDIGWLCAPAWRFGGNGRVGGFGDRSTLLASYVEAGGDNIADERLDYFEIFATLKWAVICALQASSHLTGLHRSVELATIGRRVCECEWDALGQLGATSDSEPDTINNVRAAEGGATIFGRPSARELIEAVREDFEATMHTASSDRDRFNARVSRNALQMVERQIDFGADVIETHQRQVANLGFTSDAQLVSALRAGDLDDDLLHVARMLVPSARGQVMIANPSYVTSSHPTDAS